MHLGRQDGPASDINVTPMIDVLLVLLVTFMLAQRIRQVVPVNVPPTSPSAGAAAPQIVLDLRGDRSYAINGTPVAKTELGRRLAEVFGARPVKVLYIRTAAGWRYGEVVEAADIARGSGVQVIGYMPPRR
jgi:biopolymer transport protein TolR